MSPRRNRLVLYGHFGSGNIGNDASLEAMIHGIRRISPTTELVCICDSPESVSATYSIAARSIHPTTTSGGVSRRTFWRKVWNKIRWWAREAAFWVTYPRWFRDVERFVVVGTGAVDDMAVGSPWGAPYELYKWCMVARLGGASVAFVSVGVGPIVHPMSRWLMLRALRIANYRSYREQSAVTFLRQVGFATGADAILPDLVFSLPVARREPVSRNVPLRVGLGVINYYGWKHDVHDGEPIFSAYMSKIELFLSYLLERGHVVRILSGDATDSVPIHRLRRFFEARNQRFRSARVVIEPIDNVHTLMHQIGQTDIVVASRFHNVLCALLMHRPVISIGYHTKNDDLMADMGLSNYCQHIERFTVPILVDQFEALSVNHHALMANVERQLSRYRERLDDQYRLLLNKSQ